MKQFSISILILILSINFIVVSNASAATTPIPTETKIQQQIDDLKNKIASKVAELNLVEKRGIVGTVQSTSNVQITLKDLNGNIRLVDVDELTDFSPISKTFGISDVKKGQFLGVLGIYNKQSRRILARFVNEVPTPPTQVFGTVFKKDGENFEITVVSENNTKTIFEVDVTTNTSSFSSDTFLRSGFSKIQEGQTILAIGDTDKTDPTKTIASRIIILPDINISSK